MEKIKLSHNSLDVKNPFGREKELREIEKYISTHNNLIMLGARRVGKTTLLNAIAKRKEKGYKIIRYDCEENRKISAFFAKLLVYTGIPKIFVSSIGKKNKGELANERKSAEEIIKNQVCEPFLIENIVDSDSGTEVEEKNINDSTAFLLILGNEESDEVKKEYEIAIKYNIPIFCFIKGLEDKEKKPNVKHIIEDIRENKRGIYKRYESIEEFKNVLSNSIKEKINEWNQRSIIRYASSPFRSVGEVFFTNIKNQDNRKFLILIDEFGELKRGDSKEFNDFLPYFRTKINELTEVKNCIFVLTGSENVFTTSPAKPFGGFKRIKIEKFDIETAKKLIINAMGWNTQNSSLDKIIEIIGTLPKDLVYFIGELRNRSKQYFNNKEIKNILVKIIDTDSEFKIDKQYPYLEKGGINFLKHISEILPASKREILRWDNKEEIFEKMCNEYFILEEKNGKYEFVSKLIGWKTIYNDDREKFNKKLDKLLKND
ncbi:MAG: hypothetical protein CVT89_02385 [Candidatus Altiarchaeales archaeon HGW-Altiarchaeales-2]|nr:MAG: hypothetical protein CVT89_02385 [Candidatus Altiarchaeales archaeon HGW-Altiarchaeales-2]